MTKTVPEVGAVDPGCVYQCRGYSLEAGQEDDRRPSYAPDVQEDNGRLGPADTAQPQRPQDVEPSQDGVDEPVLGVEDPDPQYGRGHGGYHLGQVKYRSERALTVN